MYLVNHFKICHQVMEDGVTANCQGLDLDTNVIIFMETKKENII